MKKYYLIGLGGTGSKCIESYTHLAAAGMAPKDVWITIVDQDQSNGNVAYAKQNLEMYKNVYRNFRQGANDLGNSACFSTKFNNPLEGICWAPLPENHNLQDIFKTDLMKPEVNHLLRVLFQENVIQMPLDKGFLGQSNAGVAVLLSVAMSDNKFWNEFILEIINAVNGGDDVYVFLLASTFGGTGTSGFPTFSRLIHTSMARRGIETEKLHIGGALLLPYFRFPPKRIDDLNEVAAHSQNFMENTQAAFKHYYRLFGEQQTFEIIYFIGWDPLLDLNYNKKGGEEQNNPPLPPELLAAKAACDYFNLPGNGYARIGKELADTMTWEDLPDLRYELGSMIRFAFAYISAYHDYLMPEVYRKYEKQAWFQNLIAIENIDLGSDRNVESLKGMKKYCEEILSWAASIFTVDDRLKYLIDIDSFIDKSKNSNSSRKKILPIKDFKLESFHRLVAPENEKGLGALFKELCLKPEIVKNSKGLGKFFATLYHHCQLKS